MSQDLSVFHSQRHPHPCRTGGSRIVLALCVALLCPPLQAEEAGVATANTSSPPQAEITWLSGGVGDEALQEMHKSDAAYNVHVIFSNRQGSYLASIPFRIDGQDGRNIVSGVSEGPLLYIKLAPGSYRFSAEIDGAWQNRPLQIGADRTTARLMFIAKKAE